MSIIWELRLYDNDGGRVATFNTWPELHVEVGVNRPAVFALRMDGNDARVALFENDGILEGWWTDADTVSDTVEFKGWLVSYTADS